MLSIGGWTLSGNFTVVADSHDLRQNFAKTSVGLMKDWGFDGIDVDWEYPGSTEDAENMVLLLQALRDELDTYSAEHTEGYHFELSIATSASPEKYNLLKLGELGSLVDHMTLMAYDFAGGFGEFTAHQANLFRNPENPDSTPFSIHRAAHAYIDGGVPPSKLKLGMPLYGRGFTGTSGLGQPFSGIGQGDWEPGIWDYKSLPKNGSEVFYDDVAKATYSWDPVNAELITYDTPRMVRKKVEYLKKFGLGGSVFWEASADRRGEDSLIGASRQKLKSLHSTKNCLSYHDSQYENIAKNLD
jgi:chitinase